MKIKRYKKRNVGAYFLYEIIIIVLGIIFSFLVINYFSKKIDEVMMPLGIAKTKKYMTEVINEAVREIDYNNSLYKITRNDKNEIVLISYDANETSKLINMITKTIEDKLNENLRYNNKYLLDEIPLGIVFKNSLLRNFGPKIKLMFSVIGSVISKLETEVKPYGINNALVEVKVNVSVFARVILPVTSEDIEINNIVLLSINVVNGSVPEGYITTYK